MNAKANEATFLSPTFGCWNSTIQTTRAEKRRRSRHLQHIPSLSVSSCWNRRRFLQAHTIWNSELNWSVFPAHPNMWCVGWSCLMSFWWTPVILRVHPVVGLISVCLHCETSLLACPSSADTLKYMAACIGSSRMTLEGPLTVWRERPLFNPFEATKKQTSQELAKLFLYNHSLKDIRTIGFCFSVLTHLKFSLRLGETWGFYLNQNLQSYSGAGFPI